MESSIQALLGRNSPDIAWWQMVFRAVTIFFMALAMIRWGGTRIFGKHTTFDIVIGIVLGSILSRAITGNSPYFPTIIAAFCLVALHKFLAFLCFDHHQIGGIIKGKKLLLVLHGELQLKNMKKTSISESDVMEALRLKGNIDLAKVKYAYLERSGEISVIL